jgi:hypothetical protein
LNKTAISVKKADFDKFSRKKKRKALWHQGSGRQSKTLTARKLRFVTVVRQEYGQHPQKWQESTDFINQEDTGVIRNHPNTAAPRPPMPKAKPKNSPETIPIRPRSS